MFRIIFLIGNSAIIAVTLTISTTGRSVIHMLAVNYHYQGVLWLTLLLSLATLSDVNKTIQALPLLCCYSIKLQLNKFFADSLKVIHGVFIRQVKIELARSILTCLIVLVRARFLLGISKINNLLFIFINATIFF